MAGDAEILQQQIAREHVAGRQVAQRIAVIDNRRFGGGRFGLAQKQIERPQAPLDIAVLDDQVIAFDPAAFARFAQQLLRQIRHEARTRQPQAPEFLRIDQAAGAVVPEHEFIAIDHVRARGCLGRAEFVANDFEYQIVRGQRKYDHDQAAIAGRMHETVDRFFHVTLQGEVALRLALLGAAEHGIEFIDGLARHEGAQQRDRGANHRQIHVKVAACIAKQRADVGARQHHRVDLHRLLQDGEGEHQRRDDAIADYAPDRKCLHAAIEHGLDQLDRLGCAALAPGREIMADFRANAVHRGVGIADRGAERQIDENFAHRRGQRPTHPVDPDRHGPGGAAGGCGAKFDFLVDADRAEQITRDGIEKRVIKIAVGAARYQRFEGELDVDPKRHVGAPLLEQAADERDAPRDSKFVQLDSRDGIDLRRMPILGQKISCCAPRDAAELLVIEAKMFGDLRRQIGGEICAQRDAALGRHALCHDALRGVQVELLGFGAARHRDGRALGANCGLHRIEVTGADKCLVLGGAITRCLLAELTLL